MRLIGLAVGIFLLTLTEGKAEDSGWKVTCNSSDRCTALLVVSDAQSGSPLASIGLQVGKDWSEPVMIAILPLGIALEPGFRAVVADKAFDSAYEACYPDGCRTIAPIPPETLDLWLDAELISVRFFPNGAENPVALDAPSTGLRAALDKALKP